MDKGVVSLLRRDRLWGENGKPAFAAPSPDDAGTTIPALLEEIQHALFTEARDRRDANITRGIASMDDLAAFYSGDARYPGWVEVQWARPTGAELEAVVEQLKALKLTIRNVPLDAAPANGACIFTGKPAVERIYVARAY